MGSFECYCALCSGPLSIGATLFGSRKGKALKKRRLRVERHKRRLAGESLLLSDVESGDDNVEMEDAPDYAAIEQQQREQEEEEVDAADSDCEYSSASESSEDTESVDSMDSDFHDIQDVNVPPPEPEPEISDNWSQTSDLHDSFDPYNTKDETESMYSFIEKQTYDPGILQPEDVKWANRNRCLAFNPSAPGVTKAYISGRGWYEDFGKFRVLKPGRDPNDTGEIFLTCFYAYESDEIASFPFHEACFEVLAKTLGYTSGRMVDKDVLYGVMATNMQDSDRRLSLDYGLVQDFREGWQCVPGEEYSLCDPSPRPGFDEELQGMLPAQLFGNPSEPIDLAHKVHSDPLSVLPYDSLLDVFDCLPTDDLKSLMKASYHVHTSTREPPFWKHMLRIRILPWFYELRTFANTAVPEGFDWKGLFLWLDALTAPEFGNQGPLMGLANRRRIWNVCQQLAPLYKERVRPLAIQNEPEDGEEARAIMKSAVSLHMPMVMYPQPQAPETISVQFIRSWAEITHRSCDLDTYWNSNVNRYESGLVGIAVRFGGQQRVFGTTEGRPGQSLHIEPNEWIKQIIVSVDKMNMFREDQDRSQARQASLPQPSKTACIVGMKVILTSGVSKTVKIDGKVERPFIVLDGMHLVGLTGQIAPNGVISRLSLLQAFRPDEEPAIRPSYTAAQQMLWTHRATSLYYNTHRSMPIYLHPYCTLHNFPPSTKRMLDPVTDMVPTDIFLWAQTPSLLPEVTAIECFQVIDARSVNMPNGTWNTPEIVGLRPGAHNQYGGRGPHVGEGGPVPSQHKDWASGSKPLRQVCQENRKAFPGSAFHALSTVCFSVDGKAGEVITEVHVDEDYRAIKLVTNKEREGYFGQKGRTNWHVKVAEEGEVLMGLATCFGSLGGWSEERRMWSHWKLSRVGVVSCKVGEQKDGDTVGKEWKKKM
ncbi:hypothetical protein EJ02DRAFT_420029 [Clathrospora elynae]|uniref:F-box domain-containing protein n=1 Tax=Clathrospora elynae TaxID=706981 RepID=A0A6A5SZY5_9PLEO|nr:hypothetical protein EJ02DRAFT_420029 [Clathrospora elynae]